MKLKNKALLALSGLAFLAGLAFLGGSAAQALNLNPFHHKHKADDADTSAPTPAPATAPESVTSPDLSPSPTAYNSEAQYDDVGMANFGAGNGVTATHASLPLPSYVEITNLNTGRTILALVNARAQGASFAMLSPQAMSLLGADTSAKLPVRVRRVNPSEAEKNALQSGQKALDRLDTPDFLLTALRRKLAGTQGQAISTAASMKNHTETAAPKPATPAKPLILAHASKPHDRYIVEEASGGTAQPAPPKSAPSKPIKKLAAAPDAVPTLSPVTLGTFYIQVAAVSNEANAKALAHKLGGAQTVQVGTLWRIRKGPFANMDEATSALGALGAKGYHGLKISH